MNVFRESDNSVPAVRRIWSTAMRRLCFWTAKTTDMAMTKQEEIWKFRAKIAFVLNVVVKMWLYKDFKKK